VVRKQSTGKQNDNFNRFDNAIPIVGGYRMQFLMKFFSGVGREMRKVSWPRRSELTRYTITVVSTVAFFAIFFAVIDLGISKLIRLILE
jgi:preprotein translocase subunit SecE